MALIKEKDPTSPWCALLPFHQHFLSLSAQTTLLSHGEPQSSDGSCLEDNFTSFYQFCT